MSLATGVVERVPGAYYSDERQAILEAARGRRARAASWSTRRRCAFEAVLERARLTGRA